MTVYHGGTEIVQYPRVDAGRLGLDFGRGFYVTKLQAQAEKWASRASRQRLEPAIINEYQFDDDYASGVFRSLRFESYDKNWLDFIVMCRNGFDPSLDYDYVEGGVADDRVIDTVEGYINGTIDAEHALSELSRHQPNHQICILNQDLIDKCLTFCKASDYVEQS